MNRDEFLKTTNPIERMNIGARTDIHVKFAGIEKAPDGQFSVIYITDQRQVLNPGQRYRIVLDGLTYEESKPTEFKSPPGPTVYCTKDGEQVPIWYCLGSFTQGREVCPYLVKATVHGAESAEVECKWRESDGKTVGNSS